MKFAEKINGNIKETPEDFIVQEVDLDNKRLAVKYTLAEKIADLFPKKYKEYLHLTLVKRNYTTQRAINTISKKLRIGKSRISYAGTKDKIALTSQKISIWNQKIEDVKKIKTKDLLLKNFYYSGEKLNLGDLSGNFFKITVRSIEKDKKENKRIIEKFKTEIAGGVPNYFGPQRFGEKREINVQVGKAIMQGRFEDAVKIILTFPGIENKKSSDARKFALENWKDWKKIIREYPMFLGIELALLNYLIQNPEDYLGALKTLAPNLLKMFIHSVQSQIFNETLSELIKREEALPKTLPLVGYATPLENEIGVITSKLLVENNIKKEQFKIKEIPYLSQSGSNRNSTIEVNKFKFKIKKDRIIFSFFLEKGSYATTILSLIIQSRK